MLMLLQFGSKGLMYWINEGGWVMWPITALGFLGVLLTIERLIVIYWSTASPATFVRRVRSLLLEDKLADAVAECSGKGAASRTIPRIYRVALLRFQEARGAALERLIENAAIHEIARLERMLWVLALITTLAPILGFLGTVVGMIESFDVLAKEGMNNPAGVAHGISVALITTAGGLIVAAPILLFYNLFTSRIGAFTNEIETASNVLLETLDEARALRGAGR
jgi:biopolymer transport protein ExbB